jgi:hypothetical protein
MNTGQMMLTAGAVVLLGMTVLTVNQSLSNNGFILQQTEIGIYKVSLGTSVLEEAMGKAFDENSIESDLSSTTSLSSTLGPESGETHDDFDDFDDYNNYTTSYVIEGVDSMTVKCKINYVDPSNPDGTTTSKTWHKKITVYVWGSVIPDTVTFTHIFSYWSFR